MSSPMNPRARGGSSLRDELKASRDDRQQIRRQKVTIPKAKAATGGAMQGFTRAWPNRAAWDGVNGQGWTFDASVDDSPGEKPSLVTDGGLYFGVSEAGWYSTHVQVQFTLGSGTPAGVLIQGNNNSSNVSTFGEVWAQNLWDGRYRASFWCGPFWLDGSSMPLGFSARVPGSWTPGVLSAASFVDVWRVG